MVDRPRIQTTSDGRRVYTPGGAVLTAFLLDRSEIAVIRGPWGSGKSLAACQRIWQTANEQQPDSRGKRRSRWFALRESYPKVEATAMATWLEWFPESVYGKLYTGSKPFLHEVRVGDVELDLFFGSVDDLTGESFFQSLEPTGWWWNELEYASMPMFFSAHARVGRYPPLVEGGPTWAGSIADMNAPPENHWIPAMMGEVELPEDAGFDERQAYRRPAEMAYFVQPPAVFPKKGPDGRITGFDVNPKAENLGFLKGGPDYYERAMIGKTTRWIMSRLANKIMPMVEGEAVWSDYDEDSHLARADLAPVPGYPVYVGLDFGRRPAAVFGQKVGPTWQVQFEAGMENAGASKFAPEVRAILARHYPWLFDGRGPEGLLFVYGDPKGEDGTQTDERTAYDVFRAHGIMVRPAPVKQNNIRTRIEAVETPLGRRNGLLISPRCRRLKMAMGGGYRYPKERPAPMEERKPIKDRYSDIADALQYMLLGGGEGRAMIQGGTAALSRPVRYAADRGQSGRRIGRGG